MVDTIKAIFFIAVNGIKKWRTSPRIFLIAVLLGAYFHSRISPLYSFCSHYAIGFSPGLFSFLMSDAHVVLIVSLGALLFFCDAPFIDLEHPYIILRSGKRKWAAGQIAYIAISSAAFTMYLFLLTLLLLLPYLEFGTEWGKAIGTLALTNAGMDFNVTIPFGQYIYFGYSPATAIPLSLFLCFSVVFFLGVLMFYLNLRINRMTGNITGAILILWQLVIPKTGIRLIRYSPISWMKLEQIDRNGTTVYPNLAYVLVAIYGMVILLTVLSILCMRKKDIDVLKSV